MKFKMDYKWVVLSVTTVGSFMASLDSTIVVIGLPSIIKSLNASLVHGIWIITGYSLMMTILALILGRLADLFGRVRLYNLGFAIFTLGSLACALSHSGAQLVAFRFLQGTGAALLAVNSVAIITDAFPREKLGMALGTNIMSMNLGAIAGYTLGGVMITAFGWPSIFLINVPIGIFGTIWGYFRLKQIKTKPLGEKFDYAGSILYCVGLTTILLALTLGDPLSVLNLSILGCGVALFIAVIFIELKIKHPTLDMTLFKIRAFAFGSISAFINFLAFGCGPFLRSLFLQIILGYSAAQAGIMLIPMEIVVFIVSPISGRMADRYGSRVLSSVGLAVNAAALFWFSTLRQNSPYSAVLISLILFGLGAALFGPPNISSIMGSVPAEKRGVANGIRMTLVMTGGVISVPFSLLLMSLVMPYNRLSQIVGKTSLITSGEMPAFLNAINHACLILGVIVLVAIIPSVLRGPKTTSTPALTPPTSLH
jgi:EmrB/QacA subfamily drug resistance transporter